MLETVDLKAKLTQAEYQKAVEKLDLRLGVLQRDLRAAEIPLIILINGWDAAGKGTAINRLLRPLDPRGFKVHAIFAPTQEEAMRPPMWRFWRTLPARGAVAIYDRNWYAQVLIERVDKLVPEEVWRSAYERIRTFERQLTDDGAVILKFWLHITKKEQAKRFKKLRKDPALAWKVTKVDLRRHKQYDQYCEAVEDMLRETSTANAPWSLVPAHDRRFAHVMIAETVVAAAETALARRPQRPAPTPKRSPRRASPLERVDLTPAVPRKEYEKKLPELQQELRRLEHMLYLNRVPAMIVYEGWDAAGKGGNIRRLTCELDPRGYEVIPIGPPQGDEKTHHYLWRFWKAVPKAGHIAIFDRSWYGRVLVERVEGFASPAEWQRAYREINEFEQQLTEFGAVLVKFWIHISPEEQLARFESREKTPHKKWKITGEDWRNREKWKEYWVAVSDMIEKTSTLHAPWTIIEGNDKLFARLKAIQVVIDAVKQKLDSVEQRD